MYIRQMRLNQAASRRRVLFWRRTCFLSVLLLHRMKGRRTLVSVILLWALRHFGVLGGFAFTWAGSRSGWRRTVFPVIVQCWSGSLRGRWRLSVFRWINDTSYAGSKLRDRCHRIAGLLSVITFNWPIPNTEVIVRVCTTIRIDT